MQPQCVVDAVVDVVVDVVVVFLVLVLFYCCKCLHKLCSLNVLWLLLL